MVPACPFDPIKRSEEIESLVMRGDQRLYYRFRSSGHYGGVVTADTVGCNLLCAYIEHPTFRPLASSCLGVRQLIAFAVLEDKWNL
ncbi:MAG: hypothetical protein LAP85_29000 [Acidobacteriia bacterium]|nr:hypothetical protein [Terriglobia bacterium]